LKIRGIVPKLFLLSIQLSNNFGSTTTTQEATTIRKDYLQNFEILLEELSKTLSLLYPQLPKKEHLEEGIQLETSLPFDSIVWQFCLHVFYLTRHIFQLLTPTSESQAANLGVSNQLSRAKELFRQITTEIAKDFHLFSKSSEKEENQTTVENFNWQIIPRLWWVVEVLGWCKLLQQVWDNSLPKLPKRKKKAEVDPIISELRGRLKVFSDDKAQSLSQIKSLISAQVGNEGPTRQQMNSREFLTKLLNAPIIKSLASEEKKLEVARIVETISNEQRESLTLLLNQLKMLS